MLGLLVIKASYTILVCNVIQVQLFCGDAIFTPVAIPVFPVLHMNQYLSTRIPFEIRRV